MNECLTTATTTECDDGGCLCDTFFRFTTVVNERVLVLCKNQSINQQITFRFQQQRCVFERTKRHRVEQSIHGASGGDTDDDGSDDDGCVDDAADTADGDGVGDGGWGRGWNDDDDDDDAG